MATKKILHHLDLNQNEIQNVVIQNLATDPSSPSIGQVWYNTSQNRLKTYDGTSVVAVAMIEDLNSFGRLIGGHDASQPLPTTGSGLDKSTGSADNTIEAGDFWRITNGGTITGLQGGSETLEAGDVLMALVDNAANASDFLGIQTNVDLANAVNSYTTTVTLGDAQGVTTVTHNLNKNNPVVVAYDSSGNEVGIQVQNAGVNAVEVSANGTSQSITLNIMA